MKRDVIILGEGGNSHAVKKPLQVEDEYIFTFDSPVETQKAILEKLSESGDTIDTLNWIGHANPSCLLVPSKEDEDDRLDENSAANFFLPLKPQKIVLWACNTGLSVAQKELGKMLCEAHYQERKGQYGKTEIVGKDMQVETTKEVTQEGIKRSFAFRLAELMPGVEIYGAPKGVPPAIISKFETCPSTHVRWKTDVQDAKPTTEAPAYRWRFVAVIKDKAYQFICKYDVKPSNVIFTYDTLYMGS